MPILPENTRRHGAIIAAIAVVVAVALLAASGMVSFLYEHKTCVEGNVGTQLFWTPVDLLNSPYEGQAAATAYLTAPNQSGSTSDTIHANSGGSGGEFSLDNWSLSHFENGSALGFGADHPCAHGWFAVDLTRPSGTYSGRLDVTRYLLGMNATSDWGEITNFSMSDPFGISNGGAPIPSVHFFNGFQSSEGLPLRACNGTYPPALPLRHVTDVNVTVPFDLGGVEVDVPVTLPSDVVYTYALNSTAQGIWSMDLGSSSNQSGGIAFQWSACA